MTIAQIIAKLVERGEDEMAEELMLLAQGPRRDGTGPNPDCPCKDKTDEQIDEELEEAAEAAGPHMFAVDCMQWPSSHKPDYKPWKEAVKEWATTDPKNCEILDKEGEPIPDKVAHKAARKFGVIKADLDDSEIDAALDEALAGTLFNSLFQQISKDLLAAKDGLSQMEGLFDYRLFGEGSKDRFSGDPTLDDKAKKEAKKAYDVLQKFMQGMDKLPRLKELEKHIRWLDSNLKYV